MAFTESLYAQRAFHADSFYANGRQLFPMFPVRGREWFVDGNRGSSVGDGRSWDTAISTMERVFENGLGSGDAIYFVGNIAEQLEAPVGVFDVSIIGAGNKPRHPDAHTGNGGYTAARWKLPASPTAATPGLKVLQQGWRFMNFLWTADTNQVCCDLFRDGGSGDAERDASHAEFIGMRFDGAGIGIRDNGGCNFVGIKQSFFRGMTTSIAHTTGAGIGTLSFWEVVGNRFTGNTNHAVIPISHGLVRGNMFGDFTTIGLNTSGGTAGKNIVTENAMMGDYDAGYVAHADDFWFNNHSIDTDSAEIDADGKTNAIPAA